MMWKKDNYIMHRNRVLMQGYVYLINFTIEPNCFPDRGCVVRNQPRWKIRSSVQSFGRILSAHISAAVPKVYSSWAASLHVGLDHQPSSLQLATWLARVVRFAYHRHESWKGNVFKLIWKRLSYLRVRKHLVCKIENLENLHLSL